MEIYLVRCVFLHSVKFFGRAGVSRLVSAVLGSQQVEATAAGSARRRAGVSAEGGEKP